MIDQDPAPVKARPIIVLQLERDAPGDTGVWLAILPGLRLPRLVDGLGEEFPSASSHPTFPAQLARFHRTRIERWTLAVLDWLEGSTTPDSDAVFGLTLALRAMGRILGIPVDIILTNGCPWDVNLQQIRAMVNPPRRHLSTRFVAEYGIEVH